MNVIAKQKYLGKKGLIILIAVTNMLVPLSLDMYLPAVPHMTEYFVTTESVVNLTLVGFYFFLAIGLLIFGPLSDKYGRKPLLLFGIVVYLVASCACAFTTTIYFLIIFRIIQALGAGCMVAVSTAVIKDSFSGKTRDTVLAVVQAMAVIAPMVAPVVGAFILTIATWRATFLVLGVIALGCFIGTLLFKETIAKDDKYVGNLIGSIGRLFAVGRNKSFSGYLLVISLLTAPYMAYIAVSSYVYIDFFGLNETTYSYFFAVNSAASILGPIIYIKTDGHINPRKITTFAILVTVVSGILLLAFGWVSPLIFMLAFLPFTIIESALRPLSTSILLDQQEHDTGSASSLLNFTHTVFGSLGMLLGALKWHSFISGLGIIIIGFAIIASLLWFVLLRSKINIVGLTDWVKGKTPH